MTAFKSYAAKHERKANMLIIPTLSLMIVNNIQPYPKRWLLVPLASVRARTDSTTRELHRYNARRGQFPRTRIGIVHKILSCSMRRGFCFSSGLPVCVCVCESVKSHLTYGASVRPENAVTYILSGKRRSKNL